MRRALLAAAVVVVLVAPSSQAAWRSAGSGAGSGAASSVDQANAPTATRGTGRVTLTWAASTMASGDPVDGYQVLRHVGASTSTVCTASAPSLTCDDAAPMAGSVSYGLVATKGANWFGAESALTPFTYDDVAPTTTATVAPTPNLAGWSRTSVTVTLDATDASGVSSGVDHITYTVDGDGPVTVAGSTASFTVNGAGSHAVAFFAVDGAGNSETAKNTLVRIDPDAPVSIATPTPAPNSAGWSNADVTLTVDATDTVGAGVASVTTKIGGAPEVVTPGDTATAQISAEGTTNVSHFATDTADNVEGVKVFPVKIDKTAPESTITPSGSGTWIQAASQEVTISGTDATSGVESVGYAVDGGAPVIVAGTSATFSLGDGDHIVSYHAVDAAGNAEPDQPATIRVDGTAPTTTASSSPAANAEGWVRTSTTVTLDPADDTSGMTGGAASLRHRTSTNGGASWSSWTTTTAFPAQVVVSAESTTVIEFQATDAAGNQEAARQHVVRLDSTAPTASILPTGSTAWRTSSQATITGADTGGSGVSHVEYKLSSGATTYTQAGDGTPFTLPEGTNTVYFHAVDVAGNVGADSVATVKVDTVAPVTTVTSNRTPNANGWIRANATLTFTATDATSGVASLRYRTSTNGGSSWSSWTVDSSPPISGSRSVSANGTTTVEYQATDVAGNQEPVRQHVVNLDKVQPTNAGNTVAFPANSGIYLDQTYLQGCGTDLAYDVCGQSADALSGIWKVELELRQTSANPDTCLVATGQAAATFTTAACGSRLVSTPASGTYDWIAVTGGIPAGTYNLTIWAVDLAGNERQKSMSFTKVS